MKKKREGFPTEGRTCYKGPTLRKSLLRFRTWKKVSVRETGQVSEKMFGETGGGQTLDMFSRTCLGFNFYPEWH